MHIPGSDNRHRPSYKRFALAMLALLVALMAFNWFYGPGQSRPTIDYSRFLAELESGNVAEVTVQGDEITGALKNQAELSPGSDAADPRTFTEFTTYLPSFGDDDLLPTLREKSVELATRPESDAGAFWYLLISVLPLVLIGLLVWAQYRRMQGLSGKGGPGGMFNIGKSKAKQYDKTETGTVFDDVAGAESAKNELGEVVSFLKDPGALKSLGGRVPTGVLLVGPPGTGKTLLARAVAGEADVPFFMITGSDFMEMFVGVGASRVRSLFEDAKKNAPAIVFIDELDSIGRRRGAGLGGGHDEREQTLNQLLSELDGFEQSQDVVVMAATNRPDILDPALLRPGRFDRRITVELPNQAAREKILKLHSHDKPLGEDVDLGRLAEATSGFSGADLENLLNEAALMASRRRGETIGREDLDKARDKILMGLVRTGLALSAEEKQVVAYHESGHAVVAALMQRADPVHKVSVVPRFRAMGATQQRPEKDKYIYRREYMLDRLAVMMGGRAAEELVFNTSTSGAGNDLSQATKLARKMVLEWGMSEKFRHMALGSESEEVFLGGEISRQREYSQDTAREADQEVKAILEAAYARAEKALTEHREGLDTLAAELVAKEEVDGERVPAILGLDPDGAPNQTDDDEESA